MAFSIAELCNQHHYLVPEHFQNPKRKLDTHVQAQCLAPGCFRCFLPLPSPFLPCQSQWTVRSLLILLPPACSTFSWTTYVLTLSKMLHCGRWHSKCSESSHCGGLWYWPYLFLLHCRSAVLFLLKALHWFSFYPWCSKFHHNMPRGAVLIIEPVDHSMTLVFLLL